MTEPPPPESSHVRLLLGAYVLGALTPEEDGRVAAHLRWCGECGAEYLAMAEVPDLLALFGEADLMEGQEDG
ncbi:zf-HC2 domain-containing protein [Streptomyces sp. NPDC053427]|uniref:zf-HC2 domain-containing protein n=1 Tax=Streptomyces sp. NPDC053427 TaxID=3365701 RepID=UPI0037D04965